MMGAACSGVTKRGVPSTKMKPSASAPAWTAVSASSRRVIPQTLTLTTRELVNLGRDVAGSDEALAPEHGGGGGRRDPADLGAGEEPALAHDDGPRRNQRQELERRLDPRRERPEVAVVEAE